LRLKEMESIIRQEYCRGEPTTKLEVIGKVADNDTGTKVTFILTHKFFPQLFLITKF
jgi:DNA gyrase/topoisomerase IV subunit B